MFFFSSIVPLGGGSISPVKMYEIIEPLQTAFYRHIESGIVKFPVKPIPEIQRLLELHEKSSLWELYQDWTSVRPGYFESAAQ